MTQRNIAHLRLRFQHISNPAFKRPADVVSWFGAVQAQDYPGALWGIGLRTQNSRQMDIERAIADKKIVRTWPMRGTLHLVASADVRWMLELLTPRILPSFARRSKLFELDEQIFSRSRKILTKALSGGKPLPRSSMYDLLEAERISTAGGRGLLILSRLAHEGLLCFGPHEGKQPTFVLLDEWVPAIRRKSKDEALAELAERYFTSHGPATLKDFVWWSGLTVADARAGIDMAKAKLAQEVINEKTYWLAASAPATVKDSSQAFLLPPYDEYAVAYQDRSDILHPSYGNRLHNGNGIFSPIIVIDGQITGLWKRTIKNQTLRVVPSPFAKFSKADTQAINDATNRFAKFLDLEGKSPG